MPLYFGDIHNHCGISYGYGRLENALAAAQEQLDFCAVTGHAFWHDIHPRMPGFEYVYDFHQRGFAKLAEHWDEVRETIARANAPGEFATFQSYEGHSRAYGDHHILSPDDDLPLEPVTSPSDVIMNLSPHRAIAIPHHIAYVPGYRGINWAAFDAAISPIVEVYSKHGNGMSDAGAYPYLHTMGPRDGRNTAEAGLALGKRCGFCASTDHHAGYPGSHGDGRIAVWADALTREAIWEAILARRSYAVTGDKMRCTFGINEAHMGSEIATGGTRHILLDIVGSDALEKITLFKNNRPIRIAWPELLQPRLSRRFKVRIEMGWGSALPIHWTGHASVAGGELLDVEPCFRGKSVLAPSEEHGDSQEDINALDNHVLDQEAGQVAWTCETWGNPSTVNAQTQALVLEIEGDTDTLLMVALNGKRLALTIGELLAGGRGEQMQPYNAEAFLVHRAVPDAEYRMTWDWDDEPETSQDVYHVVVRQRNGQHAWLSPILCVA